jgi:hypothetical protein
MDTKELNGTFWLSCIGIITRFISGALVYAIKSKCIECNICWGILTVKRDVNVELQEEKLEIENGINIHDNGQKK